MYVISPYICFFLVFHVGKYTVRPMNSMVIYIYTLPETSSSHLKVDGWNTTFPLGMAYVQGLRAALVLGSSVLSQAAGSSVRSEQTCTWANEEKKGLTLW